MISSVMSRDCRLRLIAVLVLTDAKRGAVITESRTLRPQRARLRTWVDEDKSEAMSTVTRSVSVFS